MDSGGLLHHVAGTGQPASGFTTAGEGGPATAAGVAWTRDMADDGDGNLYLMSDAQIRKVDSQGTIRTVAGGGSASDEDADGMVATEVQVVPRGIAADSSGKLYFSDGLVISAQTPRSHIYSIETDATLKLIAGNGTSVSSGDGGPATQAGLNRPAPLVFGPTNDLYIATKAAIRRVSAGGGGNLHLLRCDSYSWRPEC